MPKKKSTRKKSKPRKKYTLILSYNEKEEKIKGNDLDELADGVLESSKGKVVVVNTSLLVTLKKGKESFERVLHGSKARSFLGNRTVASVNLNNFIRAVDGE